MRSVLIVLALTWATLTGSSQSVIFSENCGNPSATTLVSTYSGWQNNGLLTFSGNADVRVTSPSSGYLGASGLGNVFITNTLNTSLTVSSINTSNYTLLSLSFGLLKTTNNSNASELSVEVSSNGTSWTALSYSVASGGSTSNKYYLVTPTGTIPAVPNLRIRFRLNKTVSGLQFRVDDIKLVGCAIPSPPTVSYSSPACNSTLLTFPTGSYLQSSATGTSTNLISPQTLTVSGTSYVRAVSSVAGCGSVWSVETQVNVTIVPQPTISLQPADLTVTDGAMAIFVSRANSTFAWQVSRNQSDWTQIDDAQRDTLIIQSATLSLDNTYYRITAVNSPCGAVYSNSARLTVTGLLPVELISFRAIVEKGGNLLVWATASETDNWGFWIEYSENARDWNRLNFVLGAGTCTRPTSYSYFDTGRSLGLTYYRLKQVDFDGDFEYSKIIAVEGVERLDPNEYIYFDVIGRMIQGKSPYFIKR